MKKNLFLLIIFFAGINFLSPEEYKIGDNDETLTLPDSISLKEAGNENGYYNFTCETYPQILIQINSIIKNYDEDEAIANLRQKMKTFDTTFVKMEHTVYLEYIVIPDEKERSLDNENSIVLFVWEIYKENRYYMMTFNLKYSDFSDTITSELKQFGKILIDGIGDVE